MDMMRKLSTALAAAAVIVAITHGQAKAAFTVCNQSTYGPVMVATAYEYDSGSDSWSRSEGFYTINEGECISTLDGLTGAEDLYLFAWASNDRSIFWDGTASYSNNAKSFCVDGESSAFVYRADDAEPPCSKGVERTFRYAGAADDNGDYTYTLHD
jgi:uncharacterized membrane protein